MACSLTKLLCKILLPIFIVCLLILQVSSDKEPHEDSKEDDSVFKIHVYLLFNMKNIFLFVLGRTWQKQQGD